MNAINENLSWIKSGKIGCTFASYFARVPELIGWKFIVSPETFSIPGYCVILSMLFPEKDKHSVKEWALNNGFYLVDIDSGLQGLRKEVDGIISWVQYFGPDADVITRRAPVPMLTLCVKLPSMYYLKVGFKGVLHVAHASIESIQKNADRLWKSSFKNTEKQLGHKPTIREAAKTTFHND